VLDRLWTVRLADRSIMVCGQVVPPPGALVAVASERGGRTRKRPEIETRMCPSALLVCLLRAYFQKNTAVWELDLFCLAYDL
jgi:hypothetical protein